MSTLNSTSTLTEVKASYDDNSSYAEDASVAKAKEFVTACRILLRRVPKRARHGGGGGEELEIDPAIVRAELKDAQMFVNANAGISDGGAGIKHVDFSQFRD